MKTISSMFVMGSFLILATGCPGGTAADSSSTLPAIGGGSSFVAADIAKTWVSDCVASPDTRLGTGYYKNTLVLNGDATFDFQTYLYVTPYASESPCSNPDYIVVTTIYGSWALSGSTGTGIEGIVFTVNTTTQPPGLMVVNDGNNSPSLTATQNAFNTDCGGTSPYCTLVNSSCTNNGSIAAGHSVASRTMTCQNYQFPNTGTNVIYNAAEYDGTTLTMGANIMGVPGVFSQGQISSTLVAYH